MCKLCDLPGQVEFIMPFFVLFAFEPEQGDFH